MQGRMAGEQSGKSGEANYRSGLHSSMPYRPFECRNANAASHRNVARNCFCTADEFDSYDREPYWRQPIRV